VLTRGRGRQRCRLTLGLLEKKRVPGAAGGIHPRKTMMDAQLCRVGKEELSMTGDGKTGSKKNAWGGPLQIALYGGKSEQKDLKSF